MRKIVCSWGAMWRVPGAGAAPCVARVAFLALTVWPLAMLRQEARAQSASPSLLVAPCTEELLLGEPLFARLALQNTGDQSLALVGLSEATGLSQLVARVEVAPDGGGYREVLLRRVFDLTGHRFNAKPPQPFVLPPGQSISDCFTIWFDARGDVPDERRLVFDRAGAWRFKITLNLDVPEHGNQRLTAQGEIKVTGRPRGFAEMVRGLRGIVGDDCVVPYRHAKALDQLLGDLKGSRYAAYVKWLRLRSYLEDGQDESGNDPIEGAKAEAEASALLALSEDLLADQQVKELPPIARDALAAKGIVLLIRGRKSEACEISDGLAKAFPQSKGMAKLRGWAH
jgi:hypothetical protein